MSWNDAGTTGIRLSDKIPALFEKDGHFKAKDGDGGVSSSRTELRKVAEPISVCQVDRHANSLNAAAETRQDA